MKRFLSVAQGLANFVNGFKKTDFDKVCSSSNVSDRNGIAVRYRW